MNAMKKNKVCSQRVLSSKRPRRRKFKVETHKAGDVLREASEQGLETVSNATSSRTKLHDTKNSDVINRIANFLETNDAQTLMWHKTCYSQYTDQSKIKRLQNAQKKQSGDQATSSTSATADGASRTLRSDVDAVDWSLCIFCQCVRPKQRLSLVMSEPMSDQIMQAAHLDHKVSLRLAGVIDLMAAKAKYHLACLRQFTRSTNRTRQDSAKSDLAMVWLCKELRYAAEKGHVLQLNDVWQRYEKLAEDSSTVIPQSYISRKTTFKDKLESQLCDAFHFFRPLNRCPSERQTLLIPTKYEHTAITQLAAENCETEEALVIPQYASEQEDIFLSLIHVALKIRGDVLSTPGHKGLDVSEEDAIACVPDSLYMFLRLLYGGQAVLEEDDDNKEANEDDVQRQVLSVAQDVIYGISRGKKFTPKHIGLATTLHQATRSKDLVHLFNKAGHCLSYDQVLQIDTALAESTLKSMDPLTGAVIPPNIVANKLAHYTADNIDILDESLDRKNTFHATQMAVWQRGQAPDVLLKPLELSSCRSLNVPDIMNELIPANIIPNKANPVFSTAVDKAWFESSVENAECVSNAKATDFAFHLCRRQSSSKIGWTVFNQSLPSNEPQQTSLGYMPIINAPAHELDTLNTVVKRCMAVSSHLGQEHTVITVDQALYCKLMELKWAIPDYQNKLIPRLGGLHISMNFLKTIGDHMKGSGIAEVRIESGLLGQGTTELVLAGKAYNKGMRSHKLTIQALWSILMEDVLAFIKTSDQEYHDEILAVTAENNPENIAEAITLLKEDRFQNMMSQLVTEKSKENANFSFWWQYMNMVSVLLLFTRAQRNGIWDLHLHSFSLMLPYFMRYDHYNYSRWGAVYLAEMHQLPPAVHSEFLEGNFVVKRSTQKCNQVDPDQAQEWINGTGKKRGGIVGITKSASALCRWTLSYNLRSHIASETRTMFHVSPGDNLVHNESTAARQNRDTHDEEELISAFRRFNVFVHDQKNASLQNIATKDLATEAIEHSLLNARYLGQEQVHTFVVERLVTEDGTDSKVAFHAPLVKVKAPTFMTLYEVVKDSKENDKRTIMKVDRNVLQRLLTAYEAGRPVDMPTIMQHELMPVPVALAEMNGKLRSGDKSILAAILTEGINCPETIDIHDQSSSLVIDGQALVVAIGKPAGAVTFGDLADTFVRSVLQTGSKYQRIDVVFDRYHEESIKGNTRARRAITMRPIRRVVEGRNVPLPKNWSNFLALSENKSDLARYLSEELIANAPDDKEIVVAGGFAEELEVRSSKVTTDIASLRATHEEADTRLVLHAINMQFNTVVVSARDTDVLLLLVDHFHRAQCDFLWMMSGTSRKRRYIPITTVARNMPPDSTMALLPFHALTGSDTTSYIANHTKRSAWKVFKDNHGLLNDLGVGELTDVTCKSVETFVCRIYNVTQTDSVDTARHILFNKSGKPESLPPTRDALQFHMMRVHYQTMIWRNAHCAVPELPSPTDMGWKRTEAGLQPILMSMSPIPAACSEIISCSCRTHCRTLNCKCRKSSLRCTSICRCKVENSSEDICMNAI